MNAPFSPEPAPTGSREELREFVYEQLWYVGRLADIAQGHAEIADDDGLRRDVRRMVAYMRAAVATVKDLDQAQPIASDGKERT